MTTNSRQEAKDRRTRDRRFITSDRATLAVIIQATRPKTEASQYPSEFSDIAAVILHEKRQPQYSPGLEAGRRVLAKGIPYSEIADHWADTKMSQAERRRERVVPKKGWLFEVIEQSRAIPAQSG